MNTGLIAPNDPVSQFTDLAAARIEEHSAWQSISRVPEMLTALVPLEGFTVRALMLLDVGQTIGSSLAIAEDIPLKIGQVHLLWGEFEVVELSMALRITRVA